MLDRRGFVVGLVAAPAIVSIGNIMPVRLMLPQLHERWLALYLAATNHLVMRYDVAEWPLPIPVNMQTASADMIAYARLHMNPSLVEAQKLARAGVPQAHVDMSMSWPQLLKRRNENEVAH